MNNISEVLADIQFSFQYLLPEIFAIFLFIFNFLYAIVFKEKFKTLLNIINITVLVLISIQYYLQLEGSTTKFIFNHNLIISHINIAFRFILSISALLASVFFTVDNDSHTIPVYYFFSALSSLLIGALFLSISATLLMIFLSFEIVSISAYVLVASQNKKNIAEAATKYLIFGLFASALMLYGFSLLFGFTGSFYIFESAFTINLLSAPLLTTSFALILIFAGIAFKLGAFPFHFWVADIYEQSSLMIVATVSIVSKIAGIALLANIMPVIWDFDFKNFISWFQPEYLIACMAMLSIAVGNIQALNQQNIHRMLGYSTIAHTGFLLLPFASFEKHAQEAVIYYSMVYVLINYAMFVAIHILDIYKTDAKFADFRGAGWKNPLLGINILIAAIALTGLPPTNGFWGKFYIFSSAFDAYTLEQEMLFLVLFTFGIINAVVGLFYYIKLPYFMFKENNKNTINYSSPRLIIFSLVLNIIVIITFLKPEWLSL